MDKKILKEIDDHFMTYYDPYYEHFELTPKESVLKLKLVKSDVPDTEVWDKHGFDPKIFNSKEFKNFSIAEINYILSYDKSKNILLNDLSTIRFKQLIFFIPTIFENIKHLSFFYNIYPPNIKELQSIGFFDFYSNNLRKCNIDNKIDSIPDLMIILLHILTI